MKNNNITFKKRSATGSPILWGALIILGLLGTPTAVMGQDQSLAGYTVQRDQIQAYNSILKKNTSVSPLDTVFATNVLIGDDVSTRFAAAFLLRPFAPKPLLADSILREYKRIQETERATGIGLSPQAMAELAEIRESLETYENRPVWQRIGVVAGVHLPFDPATQDSVDLEYYAALSLELKDSLLISVGSTISDEPQFVISAGVAVGSNAFAMRYESMERFQRLLTERRVFKTVDGQ